METIRVGDLIVFGKIVSYITRKDHRFFYLKFLSCKDREFIYNDCVIAHKQPGAVERNELVFYHKRLQEEIDKKYFKHIKRK